MRRDPFLVLGILAVLAGFIILFVPPLRDPAQAPGLVAYWWIGAPAMIIGILLMAMGYRRYRITRDAARAD